MNIHISNNVSKEFNKYYNYTNNEIKELLELYLITLVSNEKSWIKIRNQKT